MDKTCILCGATKNLKEEFYINQGYPRAECKTCTKIKRKRDWQLHGDRALQRRRKRQTPEQRRRWALKALYGITPEAYEALFENQGRCCAGCGSTVSGGRGRFHVDHSHATGSIRGILCNHCNLILGHAKDNPTILKKLIRYLQKSC